MQRQYTLTLIDGTTITINRTAVDALLIADSDNYRLFGDTVIQRARRVNPFEAMPDGMVHINDIEWWLAPALKGR